VAEYVQPFFIYYETLRMVEAQRRPLQWLKPIKTVQLRPVTS